MKRTLIALSCLVLFAVAAYGQGGIRNDNVLRADGRPAIGAMVRICTEAASGTPCSPTASIWSDKALSISKTNPIAVDAAGGYTYYASPGFYKEQLCLGGSCVSRIVLMAADVGNMTVGLWNNIRVVDGNKFTTIQAALDDSGAAVVIVPDNYAGVDETSIGAGQIILDFRSGRLEIRRNLTLDEAAVFISTDGRSAVIAADDAVAFHIVSGNSSARPRAWARNIVQVKDFAGATTFVVGDEISISNNTAEAGTPLTNTSLMGLFVSYIHTANSGSAAIATGGLEARWNNALWLDGVNATGALIRLDDDVGGNLGVRVGLDTTRVSSFIDAAILLGNVHTIAGRNAAGSVNVTIAHINANDEVEIGTPIATLLLQGSDRVEVSTMLLLPLPSHAVEIGATSASNTPFFDFHSSGNDVDYDSRIVASGGSASVGKGTLEINAALTVVERLKVDGTALVAGDFSLSAGWGTTASVGTITGNDQWFQATITSAGTGQGANPTATLTFKDGTWTVAPIAVCQRADRANQGAIHFTWTTTATTLVLTFEGTPVAAETFAVACHVGGI